MGAEEQTAEAPPAPQLVIAVTGHRPNKLGGYKVPNPLYDIVLKGLYDAFLHFKPAYVVTGMAIGTDQWAAELCINMGIPFVAAIPHDGQEKVWPPHVQARYHWMLTLAAHRYVLYPGEYEPWKMQKRNEWMINSCHQVVAVFNGSEDGGTANCIGYATQVGKPIYYVPLPPAGMPVGEWFEKTYGGQPAPPAAPPVSGAKRIVEL